MALDDACLLALERGLHLGEYDTFEEKLNLRFQDRPGLIRAPQRAPIIDGVRGDGWLGLLDARDPAYWRRHAEQDHACNLGSTWTKNLEQLLSWQPAFVVAIDCVRQKDADVALNLVEMRGRQFTAPVAACITAGTRGAYAITNCLAQAWVHGVDVHWNNMRVATHGSVTARARLRKSYPASRAISLLPLHIGLIPKHPAMRPSTASVRRGGNRRRNLQNCVSCQQDERLRACLIIRRLCERVPTRDRGLHVLSAQHTQAGQARRLTHGAY